eukprot:scaffold171930_cov17-Prasinocladus_malaysianus.AAC.1
MMQLNGYECGGMIFAAFSAAALPTWNFLYKASNFVRCCVNGQHINFLNNSRLLAVMPAARSLQTKYYK